MKLWHWRDLFTDHQTGKLRESTIWTNIGKAAMTWGFCLTVWRGQATDWLWFAFGGVIGTHELAARWLNQKQQKTDKEPTP